MTLNRRHKASDERKTQNQKRQIPCHHAPILLGHIVSRHDKTGCDGHHET